jgi:mono/diheme cytochrome c family protein
MMRRSSHHRATLAVTMSAAFWLASLTANAQGTAPPATGPVLSPGFRFIETGGEQLFGNACQACHMSDAKGAAGAGTYPSLAGDRNLEAGGYAIAVVVNGQRGMPPVGALMSDEQVAAVVNYLRTHFDNSYQDAVTAADVKTARQ